MREELTGLRKSAIVLLSLGQRQAAAVLRRMPEDLARDVRQEMRRVGPLRGVSLRTRQLVLGQFYAAASPNPPLPEPPQAPAPPRSPHPASSQGLQPAQVTGPFASLHAAATDSLLNTIRDEHPQTIALVLAHLAPQQSAIVLSGLGAAIQADVAFRIASLERASPDVIRIVERELDRRMSTVLSAQELSTVGGVGPLVAIINRADRSTERMILEGLETVNAELAETVRAQMFIFEDILTLDDKAIQLVLRNIEGGTLALALKGVSPMVKEKITRNLSTRAAENLTEEIELLGPVRLSQVEESQAKIVSEIRALEQSGQIMIQRGSDEALVD